MKFKFRNPLEAKVGHYYRARILGYDDIILLYEGPVGKLNHCATCSCEDLRPRYALISKHPSVGAGNVDVELLEEIDKPVGV